jgi:hypothetical protein
MRYSIDKNGRISAIGSGNYEHELTNKEPFTMQDSQDWRKDLETNEWIYDPIIMIPQKISKLQAVSHLLKINRYNDLMTALNTDETGEKRILFDAAHELYRDSNMVNEMAQVLGMSNEEIDNLFIEANKILV